MEHVLITLYALGLPLLFLIVTIAVIWFIVLAVKRRKNHEKVGTSLRIAMIEGIIFLCIVIVWQASHRSSTLINDWEFLGKDINSIEQKYGKFVSYSKGEDGSGYAVLDTEKLTGVELYSDTDPESGYYMEFDQTGKIVKVYCSRPIGG